MPSAKVNGVELAYQESGQGFPLVWCHEFAGSMESWEPQVHFFSRRYRVITYNARGYPPSEVPGDAAAYSQDHAVEDLYGLLRHLGIAQAHVGGLSMRWPSR
jgi:pimeloyl-ACP methyl ester carboxylesterase